MAEEYTFKRLGHLGEKHLVDIGSNYTICEIRCDGPNFSETAPVALEPRPDPTLCADCYEVVQKRQEEEEEPVEEEVAEESPAEEGSEE